MNKKIIKILICAAILSPVGLLAYDLEEYYPLNIGNYWEYSVFLSSEEKYKDKIEVRNEEIISNIKTFEIYTDGEKKNISIDSDGLKEYKSVEEKEYSVFIPYLLILPKQIDINKNLESSAAVSVYNSSDKLITKGSVKIKTFIESIEDVEVIAGKFKDCLKIKLDYEFVKENGEVDEEDCTLWLAKGVGKVKQMCFSITTYEDNKYIETSLDELTSAVINNIKIGSN